MQDASFIRPEEFTAAQTLGGKIVELLEKEQQSVLVAGLAMMMVTTFAISRVMERRDAAFSVMALFSGLGLQALEDHYNSRESAVVVPLHRTH